MIFQVLFLSRLIFFFPEWAITEVSMTGIKHAEL